MLHKLLAGVEPRVVALFWIFVAGFVVERFLPAERLIDPSGLIRNCVIGFFFVLIWQVSLIGLSVALIKTRPGLISALALSDGGNPFKAFALAFAWLALRDFFYYWFHRLQHASRWLWAEHAVHHSDEHMNITTSSRHHWLEVPLTIICVNVPLLLLFRPPIFTLGIAGAMLGMTEFSNHMNFRFGLGRFSWIIATPQGHRIHHSKIEQHLDKNFAAFFPLWDVLFATYHAPNKDEYPPTGLSSGERVTTIRQALLLPFTTWRKMLFNRSA